MLCFRQIVTGALGVVIAVAAASAASDDAALSEQLRHRLEAQRAEIPLTVNGRSPRNPDMLQQFYSARVFEPAWFTNGRLSGHAQSMVALLASTRQEGLRPEDYRAALLEQAIDTRDSEQTLAPIELELLLTEATLQYASDMLRGRRRPETIYKAWESAPRDFDLTAYLHYALQTDNLVASLRELAPQHPHYHRLRALLEKYRQIERDGGLIAVPPGETLKPGMRSPRVSALRRRLEQSGDWLAPDQLLDRELYDDRLQAAVERYQTRHGLEPDGVVGPATIESLSTSAAQRIRTIELNMERWRWLPKDLGDHYITVNIAGFRMQLVENGELRLAMPVVVGKPYHATPVFTGDLTYLVFSPYWNVPRSIAVNEILPELREDPAYLEKESMQVFRGWEQPAEPLDPQSIDWSNVPTRSFPYRFRQKPGPHNSLGRVKFMFPNKYNVYMHDTPAKSLFSHASRDFSHGCIRLQNPMALAQYLLKDQNEWTEARIAQAADRGIEQSVKLTRSWPVHILYWTAWVEPEGGINFREDIYGRDEQLANSLYE